MTVRSLFVGLSGLNAMGHSIDVIGNNISNVNTTGFRGSRASFDDIFYQTLFSGVGASGERGGINPQQIGLGAKLGSIDTIFTQGSMQTTGRLLDLAIEGKGFFVTEGRNGQTFLSRAGNFSLDQEGMIVDPGTGYRLMGWNASDEGDLNTGTTAEALAIDFNRTSKAKATENVTAAGNFDARIGEEDGGSGVSKALASTSLQGLFDKHGAPFGLVNGDQIRVETGFLRYAKPPQDNPNPIDLTQVEAIENREGVIMEVSSTTTVEDLRASLQDFLNAAASTGKPGTTSNVTVTYDSNSGQFLFSNNGSDDFTGLRLGIAPREDSTSPPAEANRLMGELFVTEGDPNFTKSLDIMSDSVVKTNTIRRADTASHIDVFDSQGVSHTVTLGLAADTSRPAVTSETASETNISELKDSEGRFLIPGGIIPAKTTFSEPKIDSDTNTATFTATKINNIVATQGLFTFEDGSGNLIALRLSDGHVSFNGEAFEDPTGANAAEFTTAGINVTDSLNVPSDNNLGGLMGNEGFSETTTLEDIRQNIEDRINQSLDQLASNVGNIQAATTNLAIGSASEFSAPASVPQIQVNITPEGTLTFSASGGSLGAPVSEDETINQSLIANAGGEDQLGLMLDLAAKTRSVRVSTVDQQGNELFPDNQVDRDTTDGGRITGFVKTLDPFVDDLFAAGNPAFTIGNTDFDTVTDTTGDPTADPPTGIDDSGVHLVSLNSGTFGTTTNLTDQNFAGVKAFEPETTAMRALFNQRGYGIARDADGDGGLDRISNIPHGIVAEQGGSAFQTNSIHIEKLTQNTVNYQVVAPNDFRTEPQGGTGELVFDPSGDFANYGDTSNIPRIIFDPDNGDPRFDGVNEISFELDMSDITYTGNKNTAEFKTQDGRMSGNLDDVSIGTDGKIWGSFTNGDVQTMGQIAMGDVVNPGGLTQEGSSYFKQGANSGDIQISTAEVANSTISSGSLELSNVDIAREFTNLIVAQRAYQANTRVITTGDQILTEVVNLKR